MSKKERDYQKELVREIRATGAVVLNKIGNQMEGSGWPDLWIGSPLFQGWLEVKNETAGFERQVAMMKKLARCSVPVFGIRMPSRRIYSWDGRLMDSSNLEGIELLEGLRYYWRLTVQDFRTGSYIDRKRDQK